MKIRITQELPIAKTLVPPIGSEHEVYRIILKKYRSDHDIYCIRYKRRAIGVMPHECEIIER